jgi:hypothetical protein
MAQSAFAKTFFGPFFFGSPLVGYYLPASNASSLLPYIQEANSIADGPCEGQ